MHIRLLSSVVCHLIRCSTVNFRLMATIKITQIKSKIGAPKHQKLVLASLGLKKIHQTVEKEDTPSVRGAIDQVKQLVTVE